MKRSQGKCKILNLGRNNPRKQYMLEYDQLENRSAEKDHEVLVDLPLTLSWQCTLAAWKANCLSVGLH